MRLCSTHFHEQLLQDAIAFFIYGESLKTAFLECIALFPQRLRVWCVGNWARASGCRDTTATALLPLPLSTIRLLTKNYGVKNGGIQYSVYLFGVTSTLFFEIQRYILFLFLLLLLLFAAASKITWFYTTIRCKFYTGRKTRPVDCPRSCFLRICP